MCACVRVCVYKFFFTGCALSISLRKAPQKRCLWHCARRPPGSRSPWARIFARRCKIHPRSTEIGADYQVPTQKKAATKKRKCSADQDSPKSHEPKSHELSKVSALVYLHIKALDRGLFRMCAYQVPTKSRGPCRGPCRGLTQIIAPLLQPSTPPPPHPPRRVLLPPAPLPLSI